MGQQVYQHTLSNGLVLLAERMDHVRSAAINFLVPAGSVVRGLVSAAVRLSLVGPAEGQSMHARAATTLDAVLNRCADLDVSMQTQTSPLHDLLAGGHTLLDSRLFAS